MAPDLRRAGLSAADIRRGLDLSPHPEGGSYRETWRDHPADGGRGAGTAILFLLETGEESRWHRIDAAELWIWQAGAPLALRIGAEHALTLGPDLSRGEALHAVVPAGAWQSAHSTGDWTLVTCVVAPAFRFDGFEIAPDGFAPHGFAPAATAPAR